mgnify:CR=1 FL=1
MWMARLTRTVLPDGSTEPGGASPKLRRFVGMFKDETAAAHAHDKAALEVYGDTAHVNFEQEDARGRVVQQPLQLSHFRGVQLSSDGSCWEVVLPPPRSDSDPAHCKQPDDLPTFSTAADAAREYDRLMLQRDGPSTRVNFPDRSRFAAFVAQSMPFGEVLPSIAAHANTRKAKTYSRYVGVERHGSRFRAAVRHGGAVSRLGTFASEEEAAVARDRAALEILGPETKLNFPPGDYEAVIQKQETLGRLSSKEAQTLRKRKPVVSMQNKTSMFRGVQWSHHHHRWRARLNHKGELFLLGFHDTELRACAARDVKVMELDMPAARLNFSPEFYASHSFVDALWVDFCRVRGDLEVSHTDSYDNVAAALREQLQAEGDETRGPADLRELRREADASAAQARHVAQQLLLARELVKEGVDMQDPLHESEAEQRA